MITREVHQWKLYTKAQSSEQERGGPESSEEQRLATATNKIGSKAGQSQPDNKEQQWDRRSKLERILVILEEWDYKQASQAQCRHSAERTRTEGKRKEEDKPETLGRLPACARALDAKCK